MRLALCQINATVGDIAGNAQLIRDGLRRARAAGAELVLFGELALTGYPPEDLLLREHFLTDTRAALEDLAREVTGATAWRSSASPSSPTVTSTTPRRC